MANKIAENVTGTIGTILWTVQLVPQIYKSWREKSTRGLSPLLVLIWSISSLFLGVYVIVENINIPLIVQPQLFGALSALSFVQCLYYDQKRSLRLCVLLFIGYIVVFAGFELGMTYAVRIAEKNGHWRLKPFFGILSTVLTPLGLLPQYVEIWKLKEVVGISLTFMALDIGGGVFSAVSIACKEHFDGVAAAAYLIVVALDGIVLLAAWILNPRAKRRRERESLEQNTSADTPQCLEAGLRIVPVPGVKDDEPPSPESASTVELKDGEKDTPRESTVDILPTLTYETKADRPVEGAA